MFKIFPIILIMIIIQSCGNNQSQPTKNNRLTKEIPKNKSVPLSLKTPENGREFTIEDIVEISFNILADTLNIDSTIIIINGKHEAVFQGFSYNLHLKNSKMGLQRILLAVYDSGEQIGNLSFAITVKPQNSPKNYSYKVINEYPHAQDAYTQGLFYYNDFLYEGTGLYGQSTLRKVDLQTGNVLNTVNLDKKYFGEGICLYDNRIYQLTWREHTGFVYNADSFEKIGDFNYSIDGWGLTTDGAYLIISDGSANLYFMDASNFSITKQIEVYSDSGALFYLNELEYINGEIWANIYNSDLIARIKPETGEVMGYVNLKDILKDTEFIKGPEDVLNGIAYDSINKRIFVTGKNWPKLFEIEIN